jgi:YD repeat-containing protein
LGYFPDRTVDTQSATSYAFYDPAGNVTTTVDADYRSIDYSYDHLDEETEETWSGRRNGASKRGRS